MNRVRHTYNSASGKGLNVAVALKNLGLTPTCIGFNFADGGAQVTEKCDSLGIPHDFEMVDGAVRVNIKVFEEETGTMTELNQPGSFVPDIFVQKLKDKVAGLSTPDGILVLTGSLPAGVPEDIYAQLTALWRGKVFLDADGAALRHALAGEAKPYAVKPNLFELENAFGVKLSPKEPKEIANSCRANIPLTCVSMGADGAILVTPDASYFSPALDIQPRGIQGAGDAMVAGLILATAQNLPPADTLRYAMAAAAASIIRDGTQMCTRDGFETMLERVPQPTLA